MARIAWKPIFLEALFVVLGVVLALGLNEWRQHIAAERHAQEALASIQAELIANRAVVAESQTYHYDLMRTLGPLRATGGQPPNVRDFDRGFISPARVVNTAWETAQRTGAFATIDYATLLALGQAYTYQENYVVQTHQLGPILYAAMYSDGAGSIATNYANLVDIIGSFWYRERELVAQYESTLAHLDRLDAPVVTSMPDSAAPDPPPDTTATPSAP